MKGKSPDDMRVPLELIWQTQQDRTRRTGKGEWRRRYNRSRETDQQSQHPSHLVVPSVGFLTVHHARVFYLVCNPASTALDGSGPCLLLLRGGGKFLHQRPAF